VEIPPKEAVYADFPDFIDGRIKTALERRGVKKLYSHQASAIQAVHDGSSIVVVTPTASGKTMCYNVPVMDAILKDEASRALFLFPTKALSRIRHPSSMKLITEAGVDVKTFTYDGDLRNPPEGPSGRRGTSWGQTRTCCTAAYCASHQMDQAF
jgi:DEAD/DEAH box helicase domain-containing protein